MLYRCIMLIFLLGLVVTPIFAQDTQFPADQVLSFPQDHYSHLKTEVVDQNAFTEWWYYTGVMNDDATGELWGFQITLFAIPFNGQTTFMYEVALSDTTREIFWHQRGLGFSPTPFGEGPAIFDDGKFSINYLEQDGWAIAFEGETVRVETGETKPLSLSIEVLKGEDQYITHAEDGLAAMGNMETCAVDKAALDGWSYYYSQPDSPTTMQVTLGEDEYALTGLTWFDHQWGNFADCKLAWYWWGLRLDDGTNLILAQILDENGEVIPGLPSGGIYYPDGSARYMMQDDIEFTSLRTWTNPRNELLFPIEWQITTPDSTFMVVPYFDDQTLPETPVTFPYWEGIVRILDEDGDQIGTGYLEVLSRRE